MAPGLPKPGSPPRLLSCPEGVVFSLRVEGELLLARPQPQSRMEDVGRRCTTPTFKGSCPSNYKRPFLTLYRPAVSGLQEGRETWPQTQLNICGSVIVREAIHDY